VEDLGKPLHAMDDGERDALLAGVCLLEGRNRDDLDAEVDAWMAWRGAPWAGSEHRAWER
jgi:hypothetical protein